MTIITLGPEGTFSHELALKLKCEPLVLAPTIHAILAAAPPRRAGESDRRLRRRHQDRFDP